MATTYYTDIQKLYVAYFNRPADVAGLQFWETVVENAKGSTAAVSAAFAGSAEYKAAYANMDAYHVVNAVYNNLFGHDADLPGLNFWATNLAAGKFTVDQAVTTIAAGAQGSDATTYNNRVAAATAFTNLLATTTAGTLDYTGAAANNAAKAFLNGVTDNASLTAAIDPAALANSTQGVINAYLDSIGQKFSLTTGIDTLIGTAGNDYFNATVDATNGATFGAFDSINGGAGTNSLTIVDTTTGNTTFTLPANTTVTNVQNLAVTTTDTNGANVDSTTITGLTSVKLNTTDPTNASAVDTVKAGAGVAVSVTSASGAVNVDGGSNVVVNSKGAVNIGATTAPTGAVSVTTSNAGTPSGATTVTDLSAGAISIKGGSTVTVTENLVVPTVTGTTGTIYKTTGGDVTITGTANTTTVSVTQTAAAAGKAGIAAVPATAATAATAASETVTWTGFTGVAGTATTETIGGVTVTFAASNTTGATYTAQQVAQAAAGQTVAGLTVSGAGGATGWTVTAPTASGATTFTYGTTNTAADVGTGTATGGATAPTAVTVSAAGSAGSAGSAGTPATAAVGAIVDGKVTIADANSSNTDGTKANTIKTVTLDGYGAFSTIASNALTSLTLANSTKDVTVTDATGSSTTNTTLNVTVNNVGTSSASATLTDNTVKTLNVTATSKSYLAVNDSAATKVTAAGAGALTLNLAGATSLASVDASANTGGVTLNNLAGSVTSVTTGSGNDTVTLNTVTKAAVAATDTAPAVAAVNATVSTGAGNDSIDVTGVHGAAGVTAGNFIVNAGDGNDTITVKQSQLVAGNTIDGGAGTDTLVLNNDNGGAFAAGDYAVINSLVTNVESAEFQNAVTALNASKLAFSTLTFDANGVVTGVTSQALIAKGNLTATASGDAPLSATNTDATYAGNLNVTTTKAGVAAVAQAAATGSTLTLNADTATVNVKSTTSVAAGTVIGGDLQTSLTVNLTNAANASSNPTGDNTSTATILADGANNTALKSVVLTGAGSVYIDAHASGALANVDASQLGGTIANGTAKGAITGGLTYIGNSAIAETITLGSGHDVITVNSNYDNMDTIVGFDAVKEGTTTASTVDTLILTAPALTLNGAALAAGATHTTGITMLTLAAGDSTLDLAFVHAASAVAAGQVVEFQFGGNTYLFADTNGNHTLDGADFALKLVGTVDLTGGFAVPPTTA
jgi:hypothetical protein